MPKRAAVVDAFLCACMPCSLFPPLLFPRVIDLSISLFLSPSLRPLSLSLLAPSCAHTHAHAHPYVHIGGACASSQLRLFAFHNLKNFPTQYLFAVVALLPSSNFSSACAASRRETSRWLTRPPHPPLPHPHPSLSLLHQHTLASYSLNPSVFAQTTTPSLLASLPLPRTGSRIEAVTHSGEGSRRNCSLALVFSLSLYI